MSWYRTLSPGERLRLEFATLIAQELYESPATLAQTLGRFRESQALQEIGMILEQGGYVEYGADGNLYLNTQRDPMTYLENVENPILVVKAVEFQDRPPTISEIRRAEQQASTAIENDNLAGHISGLLRPPIINDGIKAVERVRQEEIAGALSAMTGVEPTVEKGENGASDVVFDVTKEQLDNVKDIPDESPRHAFALFMSPTDYLVFVAETEFEPTTRFPLLRNGIQGMHQGLVVCLTRKCGPGQIYVVADDGTTAVINSN